MRNLDGTDIIALAVICLIALTIVCGIASITAKDVADIFAACG
jgi:hypothetical protein